MLLNRVGITLHEAVNARDPLEVEALLMNQLAQAEARREDRRDVQIVPNPDDQPAPSWVDDLPVID